MEVHGSFEMEPGLKTDLWQQFGASIDMLDGALRACPDPLWRVRLWGENSQRPDLAEFWYIAYHTLFWLDLYLSGAVDGFVPPAPFTLDELDPAGIVPETPYTREELGTYLEHDRTKCRNKIEALTDEQAQKRCTFPWGEVTYLGLILDSMRHVQEHSAQLNMILGQKIGWDPRWIAKTKTTGD
jgi:hypothetical protein